MVAPSHDFLRFVRAVHWRMGVMRAVEGMGLGVLGGAVLGLCVMGVTLWRGQMAGGAGLGVMAAAGVIGAIWGTMRRPDMLRAAMQADRQLELKDLLSTALTARDSADPWATTVVALADHCCQSLQPRQVVLNRLGARAWGGIAMTVLLCVSMALLAPSAAPSLASDSAVAFVSPDELDRMADDQGRLGEMRRAPQRQRSAEPDRPSGITAGVDDPAQGEQHGDAVDSDHHAEVANPEGAGGGEGRTQTTHEPDRLTIRPSDLSNASPDGDASSAGGGVMGDGMTGAQPPAGLHTSTAAPAPVAPWESDQWNSSRNEALDDIERNQVPGEYRELVREYFTR